MSRQLIRGSLSLLCGVFLSLFCQLNLQGQCDTNQRTDQVLIGSSGKIHYNGGACYQFEMHYDSSRTMYRIGEFKHNRQKLRLLDWCYRNVIRDVPTAELGERSGTEAFTVNTGDSISYYREISWFHLIDGFDLNSYYALDTLDFVVELVDASSGEVLQLLDSIGLLRQTASGGAIFYGTGNSAAIVHYVIPPSYDMKTVSLRLKFYARGSGLYDMIRFDRMAANLSDRLILPISQDHILTP